MLSLITWCRHRIPFAQLVRYGLVGLASNAPGYGLYLLLIGWGASPKLTMTALYLIGAAISFAGNRRLTFSYTGSHLGSGLRFILAHTGGYLINFILLAFFSDYLGYPNQWVQACAIVAVAGYLFLTLKFYVFKAEP